LNRELGSLIYSLFSGNPQFEVVFAHDGKDYAPVLKKYFDEEKDSINSWTVSHIKSYKKKMEAGHISKVKNPAHGVAKPFVAERLYGINKWSNENDVDLLIHVHFNDYGSRKRSSAGEFTGFAVYVPESQLPNGLDSVKIGNAIWKELEKIHFPSNQSQEGKYNGVIEDQQLIALGANGTLDNPSVLVEYGYIYEPLLRSEARGEVFKGFALATYNGVLNSLSGGYKIKEKESFHSPLFDLTKKGDRGTKVFLVQRALKASGFYPPNNQSRDDCPLSVNFGPCTEEALKSFQLANLIEPIGIFGPKTRLKFQELFR
jgi:hypothetical protein